ncbi:MAG: GNAT family N-acetyltransferase [Planctomycetes bacterium]|jgi:GNAT superfamily N-acetyltransferase|nr:GNAT family N-acetyltransferase [Planctomycetota bacterium]
MHRDSPGTGKGARIRRARPGDLPGVLRLVHGTIDACYAGVYPPNAVRRFKELHTEAQIAEDARAGITLVAEADGQTVGTGTVVGDHVKRVFVDPTMQGRGVGRAIMARLEEEARRGGVPEIRLEVSIPSRKFYETLGYADFTDSSWDVGDGQRLLFWTAGKGLGRGEP